MSIFDEEERDESSEATDDQVAEAEQRLQEASYYRSVMEANIFGDDPDPIAIRVQKKIGEFARREIAVIIGAKQITTQAPQNESLKSLSQMTGEEVMTLKLLLADLSEQEVIILRTMLGRIKDDPGAAGMFVRAGALKKPGRPVVKPIAKPVESQTRPKKQPEPAPAKTKPTAKAESKAVKVHEDGGAVATTGHTRSATVPFPTGDSFFVATMSKSESAVRAAGQVAGTNKNLASGDLSDKNE